MNPACPALDVPPPLPPYGNEALEEICLQLVRSQRAKGLLMLFIHQDERAEVVAGFSADVDDLAAVLHRLADEVAAGAGVPLGRNLHTFPGAQP